MTQAILLGAGQGSRLAACAGDQPKWMLEVAGQSLAQHLVNALHFCNVTNVLLVRGALGGTVLTPSVSYIDVLGSNNMLETLYKVRNEVKEDVIVVYCDLIIEPRLIFSLLNSKGSPAIVVDLNWRNLFSLRADDPITIAESCSLSDKGIKEIGQPLKNGQEPEAQYIGLMRFSKATFDQLMRLYELLATDFGGQPWRNASRFESAFFTDFLQEVIDRGIVVTPVTVEGGWLEFDTPRDFSLASNLAARPMPEVVDLDVLPNRPSVISAGGVAIRKHGGQEEVLLVGSGHSGEWRIPKGMVEKGESVQLAACREVFEETGVQVKIDGFVGSKDWTYSFGGREWWERCYFHLLSPLTDHSPHPDAEHSVAAWLPSNEALNGMMYENERLTVDAAITSFGT